MGLSCNIRTVTRFNHFSTHAYTHTRPHAQTLTRTHAHTLTRTHAYTHTRIHAHTHTTTTTHAPQSPSSIQGPHAVPAVQPGSELPSDMGQGYVDGNTDGMVDGNGGPSKPTVPFWAATLQALDDLSNDPANT